MLSANLSRISCFRFSIPNIQKINLGKLIFLYSTSTEKIGISNTTVFVTPEFERISISVVLYVSLKFQQREAYHFKYRDDFD